MRYIFKYKKTIHFVLRFISEIYPIAMIPNYKRTYDQIDQIENKSDLFIENWSYSYHK